MQVLKASVTRPFVPARQVAIRRRRSVVRPRSVKVNASLAPQYGYVLGSVAFTAGVLQYLAINVIKARRASGVKYPKMYAEGDDEQAMIFNCTQGLQYPIYSAVLGMVWNIGRIMYAQGYSTGDPSKRGPGAGISFIAYFVMIVSTFYGGLKLANILPA